MDSAYRMFEEYRARLMVRARRYMGGSQDDAEDVVSDCWILFVKYYPQIRTGHTSYLWRILRACAVDKLRRKSSSEVRLVDEYIAPERESASLDRILWGDIKERFAGDPMIVPMERLYLHGETWENACPDMNLGTFKCQVFRLKKRIREVFAT